MNTVHRFAHHGLKVWLITFSLLLADQSFGQGNPDKGGSQAMPDSNWSTFIRESGYVHQFDTDMENSNSSFTAERLFIQVGIRYAPDRSRSISLSFGYGYDDYDFNGENGFGGLRPWDNINTFRVSLPIRGSKGEHWSYFIVPTLRITGENNADFSDSLTGGGFAGFAYRFNDRLSIGPGLGVMSQIEDDASIFPIIIINWKITETLSLETGRGLGATLGPGISLNWRATEQWLLTMGTRYEKLRFRLNDSSKTPNGVGQDESWPFFVAITYNFSQAARISLIGGLETAGELRLEDSDGNVLQKEDYQTAKFLGCSFYFRF